MSFIELSSSYLVSSCKDILPNNFDNYLDNLVLLKEWCEIKLYARETVDWIILPRYSIDRVNLSG